MIRRFNYTSRQKIRLDSVAIHTDNVNRSDVSFSCEVTLGNGYSFPSSASIYVDVNKGSYAFKRFSMGSVGSPSKIKDQPLPEFASFPSLTFYVSVVATGEEHKRILGKSTAISLPRSSGRMGTSPLLEVTFTKNIKQVWKLDFDSGRPVLLINSEINRVEELLKHDYIFKCSVLPAVLKEVLYRYFIIEREMPDEDDEQSVKTKWIRFVKETCGIEEFNELFNEIDDVTIEDLLNMVDRIVDVFTEKFLPLKSNISESD